MILMILWFCDSIFCSSSTSITVLSKGEEQLHQKISSFWFFCFQVSSTFHLKVLSQIAMSHTKRVRGGGKDSIIILEIYFIDKIDNLTNIKCLLNCIVNIPKISFVLELLYVVNMKTKPSYPVSRKLSYLQWSNLKGLQNSLIKYAAFQDWLCIFFFAIL